MATCPVCGMSVDETTAPVRSMYQGRTYYFCSSECKKQFDAKPEQYVPQPQTTR